MIPTKNRIINTLCMGIVSCALNALDAAYTYIGNISSLPTVNGNTVLINCTNADVQIKICGQDVIKVWCDPEKTFARTNPKWYSSGSFVVDTEDLGGPATITALDKGTYYEILTDLISIQVQKTPMRISFYDKNNTEICSDYSSNGMGWDAATGEMRCWKKIHTGENFFGLGQSRVDFNKTGKAVINWNKDLYGGSEPFSVGGNDAGSVYYTSNPFFISTKGYGIYFDNSSRTVFNMGKENSQYYFFGSLSPVAKGEMIYYFIYGPNLKKVITRYTDMTGKSFFPPRWTFGNMQSHWGYTQNDVDYKQGTVSWTYRNKNIPCDAMICDIEWYACQCAPVAWNRDNFPNAVAMIKNLHDNGFKVLTIDDPNISDNQSACTQAFSTASTNNYFAQTAAGQISKVNWPWGGSSGLMDFFNTEAQSWWGQLHTPRMDEGIDGFWLDMNEPARYNADMRFNLSKTTPLGDIKELHNVYALAHARTNYLWMRNYFDNIAKNNKRPFLIVRGGFCGQQKFALNWSGDISRDWDWYSSQIYQAMSAGICGFPLWSHDLGGFMGSKPSENLMGRWIEFGAFSPICRFHYMNGDPANEPWQHGTKVENIARTYLQLRYRLKPYLYNEIAKSVVFKTGLPIMRALVLEYQDDVNTFNQSSEYLYGSNLLIAPVVTQDAVRRSVYLPKGSWIDYWDGTEYTGPQTIANYSAPLEKLPIFVRAGAIIPMYPVMNFDKEKPADPITYEIYPQGTSADTLYEDEGETHEYQKGKYSTITLNVQGYSSAGNVTITVGGSIGNFTGKLTQRTSLFSVLYRQKPDSISCDNVKLVQCADTTELNQMQSGWCFAPTLKKGIVLIKTGPLPADKSFTITISNNTTGINQTDSFLEIFKNGDIFSAQEKILLRFAHTFTGILSVSVYSINGKNIIQRKCNVNQTREVSVWDGCNKGGHRVGAGAYCVIIKCKSIQIAKKVGLR